MSQCKGGRRLLVSLRGGGVGEVREVGWGVAGAELATSCRALQAMGQPLRRLEVTC